MRLYCILTIAILFISTSLAQQVQLQWDANREVDLAGYRLYRSETAGGPYEQVGEVLCGANDTACTTFVDTTPQFVTPYYYVATAFNTSGAESGHSNQVNVWVLNPTPPAPPSNLLVTEQGVNVQASWEGDAAYYAVFYRPPTSDEFRLLEVVSTTSWEGRLPPPGHRRGGELGVASFGIDGHSVLMLHSFQ